MENFILTVTPEVAVLLRAALIAALLFGLEALSKARREVGRKEVGYKVKRAERAGRERVAKKRIVRA